MPTRLTCLFVLLGVWTGESSQRGDLHDLYPGGALLLGAVLHHPESQHKERGEDCQHRSLLPVWGHHSLHDPLYPLTHHLHHCVCFALFYLCTVLLFNSRRADFSLGALNLIMHAARSQWTLVMFFLTFFATFAVEFRHNHFYVECRDTSGPSETNSELYRYQLD